MKTALPPLTTSLIEAFAACAIAWLVRLLGVLTAPNAARRAQRLRRFVNHIERVVECIIFLKAIHAFGPPPRRRRHPGSTPRGFRRARPSNRLLWKGARIRARRASFIDRVARLLEALAHSDLYVARFTKRLLKGLRAGAIIPFAPPAIGNAVNASNLVSYADSS